MGIELQSWNAYQVIPDEGVKKLLGVVKTNPGKDAKKQAIGKAMKKWGVHGATIGWHVEVSPVEQSEQLASNGMRQLFERLQMESMVKVGNEKMAKEFAKDEQKFYGMSVFDGKWYIGEIEELKKLGINRIMDASGKVAWEQKFRFQGKEI